MRTVLHEILHLGWLICLFIVTVLVGGFLGILGLTGLFTNKIDWFVEMVKGGVPLSGEYLLKTGPLFWAMIVALVLLAVLIACVVVIYRLANKEQTVDEMRRNYNDMLDFARSVTHVMYASALDKPDRLDVLKARVINEVFRDGSTRVVREYAIKCVGAPAHRLEVQIEADGQTSPLAGHRAITFSAKDQDTGETLHWIPSIDSPNQKTIVIFFPEMQPGDTKNVHIEFKWQGYAKRLVDEGSTEFWWSHKAATRDSRADLEHIWKFEPGYGAIAVIQTGARHDEPEIRVSKEGQWQVFTYKNDRARADNEYLRFRVSQITRGG